MKQTQIQQPKNMNELSHKTKLLLLISISLPLIILISTAYIEEKQHLFKLLGLKDLSLIQQVQTALSAIQKHIQQNKIQLDHHYTQYPSVDKEQNAKQKIRRQNFYKEIQQLKHSQLKYFSITNNDSLIDDSFNNKLNDQQPNNCIKIQIFNRQQIKQIKEIQHLSMNNQRKPWIQIADRIIFTVNLVGINSNQSPLSQKAINLLQKSLISQLRQNSFIKKLFIRQNQSQSSQTKNNLQLEVIVKSGHISEIEQNSRKKLQYIFQHQQLLSKNNKENTQEHKKIINQVEFYAQQLFSELQNTNKGQQCLYFRNYTQCKEFRLFIIYDSVDQLYSMSTFDGNSDKNNREFTTKREMHQNEERLVEMKNKIKERVNKGGYWSREDNSMSLITFHPFTSQYEQVTTTSQPSILHQMNHQMFTSTINQIIYQNLNISPFLLLTSDLWHFQQDYQRQQNIQILIDQFIELNLLYKTKTTLQHIHRIITAQSPIYELIPSSEKHAIISLTNFIQKYIPCTGMLLNNQLLISNSVTSPIINSINYFDPFPNDYIIGALIPTAIILIYPLFGLLKTIFQ